jgi:hypothetical protein
VERHLDLALICDLKFCCRYHDKLFCMVADGSRATAARILSSRGVGGQRKSERSYSLEPLNIVLLHIVLYQRKNLRIDEFSLPRLAGKRIWTGVGSLKIARYRSASA